jgi:MscS family membrane protein
LVDLEEFRAAARAILAVALFRAAMEFAPPAALARLYLERVVGLAFVLSIAWCGAAIVDFAAERWRSRLDPRVKAMSYSVLPLGRQVVKLAIYLIALLSVFTAWGYNMSTVLAGLGVGGLAVALAAQKTIENLFGGVSVIGDRPVLVGDYCRFGAHSGTVMHIGLRSTRLRTVDRTIICIPNGQFSSLELENFSARDKILFHQMLSLRRDTTSEQMLKLLAAVTDLLSKHPKLETGGIPVRFTTVGTYSLDVEIFAYVTTADYDEFLAIQQDLLLRVLQCVEQAGTALAVPLQESVPERNSAGLPGLARLPQASSPNAKEAVNPQARLAG